jgi:hypothetical protein
MPVVFAGRSRALDRVFARGAAKHPRNVDLAAARARPVAKRHKVKAIIAGHGTEIRNGPNGIRASVTELAQKTS